MPPSMSPLGELGGDKFGAKNVMGDCDIVIVCYVKLTVNAQNQL